MRVLIANAGDWTFVNTVQFLVAVGALATAIVAVVALFLTRRSVKLAQDELETTTAALESSVRPLLTFDKRAFMRTVPARDLEPAIVSVPVRNVGPGVAVVQDASLEMGAVTHGWRTADLIIPAQDVTLFEFNWDGQMSQEVRATIRYTDLGGVHRMMTALFGTVSSEDAYRFRRVEVVEMEADGTMKNRIGSSV